MTKLNVSAFLSHNSEEKETVDVIAEVLHKRRIDTFYDRLDLVVGDKLSVRLEKEIHKTDCLLFFIGSSGCGPWQIWEAEFAAKIPDKRIITVILPSGREKDLPEVLRDYLWMKIDNEYEDMPTMRKLYSGIKGISPRQLDASMIKDRIETKEELYRKLQARTKGYYKNLTVIGTGETSVMMRAEDRFLERRVVIKAAFPWTKVNQKALKNEVHFAAALNHRAIMPVYSARLDRPPRFIVTPWIDGMDLAELLDHLGPQPYRFVQLVIQELADALYYAHLREFVHKELYPSNILIDEVSAPKISPFEIFSNREVSGFRTCTLEELRHWSPEQEDGLEAGPHSDQFQLGVVAFEMLTGRNLFPGTDELKILEQREYLLDEPKWIRAQLKETGAPDDFVDVALKLLAENPDDRWEDLRDVVHAIEDIELTWFKYMEDARESWDRVCAKPQFLPTIFERFGSRERRIRNNMAKVDMDRYGRLLRYVAQQLFEFNHKKTGGPRILAKVVQWLRVKKRKVRPEYLDWFLEDLLVTVSEFDPRWRGSSSRKDWLRAVEPAFRHLKSEVASHRPVS